MSSKEVVPAPGAGALGADTARMPPPPPRLGKRKPDIVLDEDDWASKLEAIIERDYFPELGKLQDKVRWLEALRSGDPEQIRAAQLAIAYRQTGNPQFAAGATPAGPGSSLFTPGGTAARLLDGATPRMPLDTPGLATVPENTPAPGGAFMAAGASGGGTEPSAPNMSLDTFLAQHTSEDNASFSEILQGENKKRREKAAKLLQAPRDRTLMITDGREKSDGYGTGGQSIDTLAGWNYQPINMLMYSGSLQESKPYSSKELADMVQGPPKQINARNTRFKPTAVPGQPTPSTSGDTAPSMHSRDDITTQRAIHAAVPAQHGGVSGYDILATPRFEPGVDATPIVTWGDIEATPMRIEAEDLPPGPIDPSGRSFRMNAAPAREERAHALASKAATSLRKRALMRGATPSLGGAAAGAAVAAATGGRYGTPSRTPARTPGGAGGKTPLSAAAKKLASGMRGKGRHDADMALRASYGQTPVRAGGGGGGGSTATPSLSHGSSSWTPAHGSTPVVRPSEGGGRNEARKDAGRRVTRDLEGR